MLQVVPGNAICNRGKFLKAGPDGVFHYRISLDYSWRKGEHPKQGKFNPDFFLKIDSNILVVEIKADADVSDENKAKLRYAKEHFKKVNNLQKKKNYYFKFLSPNSYEMFFQSIREKTYSNFKSEIEAKLEAS